MNKHQKEKSREIRDIMRSDGFGRMTYKEARRKWRAGIRAFRIGDMYAWKEADLAHLGFNRKKLQEVGKAFHKVLTYCGERNLAFDCFYESKVDAYTLRFTGRSVEGERFGIMQVVSGDKLRYYKGSLLDITHRVLDEVECRRKEFIVPKEVVMANLDDRSVEDVFSKIIVKE